MGGDITKLKALPQQTQGKQTGRGHRFTYDRPIIPIVFIPGAMGSRLRRRSSAGGQPGEVVWDPGNVQAMVGFVFELDGEGRAEDRRERLIGDRFDKNFLQVDNDNESMTFRGDTDLKTNFSLRKSDVVRRGWGGILWGYYRGIILALHEKLRERFERDLRKKDNVQAIKIPEFPVYAYGYNWTLSNKDVGKQLAKRIDEIVGSYNQGEEHCPGVILVTHSMGGLVARAACKQSPFVLGVIHAAQPVLGAAAAYRRMRAGWENDILGMVFGSNGRDVSVLLGSMPSALQLLPNRNYGVGPSGAGKTGVLDKKWLKIVDHENKPLLSLPKEDPYEEIYMAKDSFWSLYQKDYLVPRKRQGANNQGMQGPDHVMKEFEAFIKEAKSFHEELGADGGDNKKLYRHEKKTYNIYVDSKEIPTIDYCTFKLKPYVWRLRPEREQREIEQKIVRERVREKYAIPPILQEELLKKELQETLTPQETLQVKFSKDSISASDTLKRKVNAALENAVSKNFRGLGTNDAVEELRKLLHAKVKVPELTDLFKGGFSEFFPLEKGMALDMALELPQGAGDGTVPVASGRALVKDGSDSNQDFRVQEKVIHDQVFNDDKIIDKTINYVVDISLEHMVPRK